jgi:hypothetical protein
LSVAPLAGGTVGCIEGRCTASLASERSRSFPWIRHRFLCGGTLRPVASSFSRRSSQSEPTDHNFSQVSSFFRFSFSASHGNQERSLRLDPKLDPKLTAAFEKGSVKNQKKEEEGNNANMRRPFRRNSRN